MHEHALWYSADEKITIGELKKGVVPLLGETDVVAGWCDGHGVGALVAGESDYHYKISTINAAPYIVYYMGDISLLQQSILSIVGPRKMTGYADQVLQHIFSCLGQYQLVTLSGGADGVDMLVHKLSLQNNIPTILVLGGGLRHYRQSSRQSFLQKVVDNGGLILSEFKLDMKPTNYSFPQRNRIVAGLADVVCVPEAGVGSGSLITVDFALAMRKPVYGIPGSIFSQQSAGLHHYISEGKVQLLHDVSAMLSRHFDQSDAQEVSVPTNISLTQMQQTILQLCSHDEMTIDSLLSKTSTDVSLLLESLTILEMYGLIMQVHPGEYRSTQKIAK